jgi:predicted enzyme related to lactoylglutathione lyase
MANTGCAAAHHRCNLLGGYPIDLEDPMTDTAVPRFHSVALDCPDPTALAGFYARLLDWPAPTADDEWVTLAAPGDGPTIAFQRAAGFVAPTWPSPEVQQQLHLDLVVDDIDAAHDRAVALGARHLDTQDGFRVYGDPAGHPFCLCAA